MSVQARKQLEQVVDADSGVVNQPSASDAVPVVSPDQPAANDNGQIGHGSNLIKRTVDEVYTLMAEAHEIREDLFAHGIRLHMLNNLIELGVSDKAEELAALVNSAVRVSVEAHGSQAITREELERGIGEIVVLEKDLRHIRQVAARQGVHMQAFNHLTQLMRLNPGDGGVQAINTFIAYAEAAGVPLDRINSIRKQYEDGPDSVLPDIARDPQPGLAENILALGKNLLAGLAVTALVMWLVL